MSKKRILVAWFRFTVDGAIGRFIQVARVLEKQGHEVRFTSLTDELETDWPDFPGPILTFEQAASRSWDALFLPGPGVGPPQMKQVGKLRRECFGLRVQHIQNDPSLRKQYAGVNGLFHPDLVVFNSSRWRPADFRLFIGRAFVVLPGAVDMGRFRPGATSPGMGIERTTCRIGGFCSKNVGPLLDAFDRLPRQFELHLFGAVREHCRGHIRALLKARRVIDHGLLFGDDRVRFYQNLDLFVITERRAGWCDEAAEAFACGVPTIVAPPGTTDFAVDGENCRVLDPATPGSIRSAILELAEDRALRERFSRASRAAMGEFDGEEYCRRLLDLVESPPSRAYYRIPGAGLFGRWTPEERMDGLDAILEHCSGATVLDLGCAEGAISYALARRGAQLVHAFEMDGERVAAAARTLASLGAGTHQVRRADLSDLARFQRENRDILRARYDVVLFLGVYHLLPEAMRDEALDMALQRSKRWFAMRSELDPEATSRVRRRIRRAGFRVVATRDAEKTSRKGWLAVFEKRAGG